MKKRQYTGFSYNKLGHSLGISKEKLESIKRNHGGDIDLCLLECLSAWLCTNRYQDEEGRGPTWETLVEGLEGIDEETIAHGIYKESMYDKYS